MLYVLNVALDRVKWRAFVDTVMNFRISWRHESSTNWRNTVKDGVSFWSVTNICSNLVSDSRSGNVTHHTHTHTHSCVLNMPNIMTITLGSNSDGLSMDLINTHDLTHLKLSLSRNLRKDKNGHTHTALLLGNLKR